MPKVTRITLTGTNPKSLDKVCEELRKIAEKTGVKFSGPVYLPTRRIAVSYTHLTLPTN